MAKGGGNSRGFSPVRVAAEMPMFYRPRGLVSISHVSAADEALAVSSGQQVDCDGGTPGVAIYGGGGGIPATPIRL
jgi:hypothetical protein